MSEEKIQSNYLRNKKVQDAQNDLIRAIDEYKAVLKDSIHPDNQNAAYKKRELSSIDKMIKRASDLDMAMDEPGAGIFSLISLLLSANLYLKNEIIKTRKQLKDYEIKLMKLESRTKIKRRK